MIVLKVLYLCLFVSSVRNIELRDRKLTRLVGGHLRLVKSNTDDTDLLATQSSNSKQRYSEEKGSKNERPKEGDEEKKTLSQQVSEGKYGLIQRELFKKPLKQPGVISYDDNPEIPKDNISNLGGLNKEDIWLAENHLLVLKGGVYPKPDNKLENLAPTWPLIDNYTAPKRPVKLSLNPKVPPPFPVQLTEDGPLQILGTNSSRPFDDPSNLYAVPAEEGGYVPGTGPFFPPYTDQANTPSRGTSNQDSPKTPGEFPQSLNGTLPPYFAHLPPGTVAVPPPAPPSINDFNVDDPSIYYPPPYSFSYPTLDNSSKVAAGPLVPGIILPPPPDFFAVIEEEKTTKRPAIFSKGPNDQKVTEKYPNAAVQTTTPIPSAVQVTLKKPTKLNSNDSRDVNSKPNPIITSTFPTSSHHHSKTRPLPTKSKSKSPAVTILKPVKSIEPHITYYSRNLGNAKPFPVYGPPATTVSPEVIDSTHTPLRNYYNSNNFNVVTERSTVRTAEYYYYEEEPQTNSITTPQPERIIQNVFNLPSQYYKPPKQIHPPRTQYIYVTAKPDSTPKYNLPQQTQQSENFRRNLASLKNQIRYHTSPKPMFRQIHSPKPVYQYSFQAANYKPHTYENDFRPSEPESLSDNDGGFRPMPKYSVQIQPAIEISVDQRLPQNPIYFQETFRTTTQKPAESQKQYTTAKSSYSNYRKTTNKRGRNFHKPIQYSSLSDNTDLEGYYVKPHDTYYESNSQQYSTFGRKIPNHTTAGPRYTTRAPDIVYMTTHRKIQPQPNHISLEGDTLVNYINSRPALNPNAQFIPIEPSKQFNHQILTKYVPQNNLNSQNQNTKHEQQILIELPNDPEVGSFISYPLPGDNGAHFYFRTPQLIHRNNQDPGYLYQKVNERIRKNKENEYKR